MKQNTKTLNLSLKLKALSNFNANRRFSILGERANRFFVQFLLRTGVQMVRQGAAERCALRRRERSQLLQTARVVSYCDARSEGTQA